MTHIKLEHHYGELVYGHSPDHGAQFGRKFREQEKLGERQEARLVALRRVSIESYLVIAGRQWGKFSSSRPKWNVHLAAVCIL